MLCLMGCQEKQLTLQSFPQVPYSYIKVLSLDTAYLYTSDLPLIDKGILKDFKWGPAFVDSMGLPIHQKFQEVRLNTQQQAKLDSILRPTPIAHDFFLNKVCMPIFRDVIIFYNQEDQPLAQVQVCSGCKTSNFIAIQKSIPDPSYGRVRI